MKHGLGSKCAPLARLAAFSFSCAAGVVASAQPDVNFTISEGRIVPSSDYAMKITIAGSARATDDGRIKPVTMRLRVGDDTHEPFGPADRVTSNVNRPDLGVRHFVIDQMMEEGTAVDITTIGWSTEGDRQHTRNTAADIGWSMVLRNGDPVPDIEAASGQERIAYFIQPYLTEDGEHVWLHDNQVIILCEVGSNRAWGGDFQDLVVLVTFGESVHQLKNEDFPPKRNYAVPMRSAPMLD